jgi:hypothetical protein
MPRVRHTCGVMPGRGLICKQKLPGSKKSRIGMAMRLTLKFTLAASTIASCLAVVLAAVAREDQVGFIEVYESWGNFTLAAPPPEMKPIVLQVPEAFRYGSSKGRRAIGGSIS